MPGDITPPTEGREFPDSTPPPITGGDDTGPDEHGATPPTVDDYLGPRGIFPGPNTGDPTGPRATGGFGDDDDPFDEGGGSEPGGRPKHGGPRIPPKRGGKPPGITGGEGGVVPRGPDGEPSWPPFVELPDGRVVPMNPWNKRHQKRARDGFGRWLSAPVDGDRVKQYAHGSSVYGEQHIMHPQTEGFASLLLRPQAMTGEPPEFRSGRASRSDMQGDDFKRPAVMRMEAIGAEVDGEWAYDEEPFGGRMPTSNGGLWIMPPSVDMADLDDDFTPPGSSRSTTYLGFTPEAYLAFGKPEQSTGDVQNCGFRMGYDDAASELVIESKATDTWSPAMTLGKAGSNPTIGLYGTTPAAQASAVTSPSMSGIGGSETVSQSAIESNFSFLATAFAELNAACKAIGITA